MGCTDDNTLHSAATGACLAEFSLCLRDCSAHAISLQRENEAQELLALVVVKWWQCSRWELSPPWDARHCWAGMLHVRAGFAPAGQAWRVFYCNNKLMLGNNWSLLFKVRCSLICSDILSGLQRPWLLTAFLCEMLKEFSKSREASNFQMNQVSLLSLSFPSCFTVWLIAKATCRFPRLQVSFKSFQRLILLLHPSFCICISSSTYI